MGVLQCFCGIVLLADIVPDRCMYLCNVAHTLAVKCLHGSLYIKPKYIQYRYMGTGLAVRAT